MNSSMILQMAQIYRVPDKKLSFSIKVLVEQQSGYRDCGRFAIAFATEIYRGQDQQVTLHTNTDEGGTSSNVLPRGT